MLCGLFNNATNGQEAVAALVDPLPGDGENGVRIRGSARLRLIDGADLCQMIAQPNGDGQTAWKWVSGPTAGGV